MHRATLAFSALSVILFPVSAQVNVLTWHNDNARTGQNVAETILTPANVKVSSFGKIGFVTVDGAVDAAPLVVSNVNIPVLGPLNVLYIATENDSVYAANASTGAQLWQVSMLLSGETPSDDRGCDSIKPVMGITATPVIDLSSGPNGTIYVVAMSKDSGGGYHQRLHALDLTTGIEEFGGPIEIQAQYPGKGAGSVGGVIPFSPGQYKERTALLLVNGVIYTTWASNCDVGPYTGWIIGYDEATLAQKYVLNVTPNGTDGGMWGSGAGPSAGPAGAIYTLVGNGTFDTKLGPKGFPARGDYGNAFLEMIPLNGVLRVTDYFTMYDTMTESENNEDLGSGGTVVIPPLQDSSGKTHFLVAGAGKDGTLYLADRKNMGRFNSATDQVYQELPGALPGGMMGAPAYFNGMLYYGALGDYLRAFQFQNAMLLPNPASISTAAYGYPGATPSISANGNTNGIVWVSKNGNPAELHAYDANNLATQLYNSSLAGTRDQFGAGNKFITPVIANGRVYVGSTTGVGIFGLLQ